MKSKQEIMQMTSISEATLEVLTDIRDLLAQKTEFEEVLSGVKEANKIIDEQS